MCAISTIILTSFHSNLKDKAIIVGAQIAKKRSRRVVEMVDCLHAWLTTCHKKSGPIVDAARFRDNLEELKAAAGLEHWPHNGLRHSFGSYHLAAFGDQMKTAAQMGHRDSSVIHNHYKALVLKAEAEKYWKLSPEVVNEGGQENDPKAKEPAGVKPKAIHEGGENPAPE